MKSFKYSLGVALLLFAATACDQEIPELQEPEPAASQCEGATAGSADFTKFVAIGNSFVAGFQAGALFTAGQNNSLPAILNKQFECVGAPATFNQPNINASLGWNLFITQPFLTDQTKPILGRMLLQGASPRPTPQAYPVGILEALPNPSVNPGFLYGGNKAQLQNFAVPAITVGQVLTPATGDFANPSPALSPFYGRFASAPGASMILTDANAANGTFVLVWLGLDDFFLHAAYGGDPTLAPLTSAADFQTRFGAVFLHPAIGLFTVKPTLKGVVANFPNIFIMPHFTSVPYNAIPMTSQAQVDQVNAAYAPYNGGIQATPISAEEKAKRTITFQLGANAIVIEDETLTDLSAFGLPSIRQATAADKFPLATGSVLGTEATPGNPTTVWGVGKALTDRYALIPSEIQEIENARIAYNNVISGVVAGSGDKLALADINAAMNSLAAAQLMTVAGTIVSFNINPPTGIFSEDGVHPNSRGYAFLSRTFIEAINTKFGATIPLTPVGWYKPTALPIP
jgi:lysophospholipase L1-like esterase